MVKTVRNVLFAVLIGCCSIAYAGIFDNINWSTTIKAGIEARDRGDIREAIAKLEAALKIAEEAYPDGKLLAQTETHLAVAYIRQARYREAERLLTRAVSIFEKLPPPDNQQAAAALLLLANTYTGQGRDSETGPLFKRALAIAEKSGDETLVSTLMALGRGYVAQHRYWDAEPLFTRALSIQEKALGLEHLKVGQLLNQMANMYKSQHRFAQAEALYKRSIAIEQKALGPEHPSVAGQLDALGLLYISQRRYTEAEPLLKRSLEIREKVYGSEDWRLAPSLYPLSLLFFMQKRYTEAELLAKRCVQFSEKVSGQGPSNPLQSNGSLSEGLGLLGNIQFAQGRYAEAESILRRALTLVEERSGQQSLDLLPPLSGLALVYRAQKRIPEALDTQRRAIAIVSRVLTKRDQEQGQVLLKEQQYLSVSFETLVGLLFDDSQQRPDLAGKNAAEAFEVAQLARGSDTAEQVARMAARFSTGNDALAQLARQSQDLNSRADALDTILIGQVSLPAGRRDTQRESQIRDEQATLHDQIAALNARLRNEFPRYHELVNPQPLALDGAQKLLGADEALVVFVFFPRDESYAWVVRRSEANFQRLTITRGELATLVRKLRTQLDLGSGDPAAILGRPFNVAAAHELYLKLLAPMEPMLAGASQLIVVPDGALQSLPLGVLVTNSPDNPTAPTQVSSQSPSSPPANDAGTAWLVKKYAVTVLPSVNSLRALRAFAGNASADEPFIGFGDPLLEGGTAQSRRSALAALLSRGAVADVKEVRKLQRLPETADELNAIAKTLNGKSEDLYLGQAATETKVKSVDLSQFRNIVFATHGIMAGEFAGSAEPALVLTPPQQGTELDDGLLTASEITQLKLNADWVILSACNTAAPDGTPGAEGLSGLAKAFFYAGARSLLVSNWAVSSDATVALTTRMFAEAATGASKAQALQRSMLALMRRRDKPYFSHPAFWAPFEVVGEGNSGWAGAGVVSQPRAAVSQVQ